MRYAAILLIWTLCYFLPPLIPDRLYDPYFNIWQSAISMLLLFSVLRLSQEWWTKEFGCLCVLQVAHNAGDYFFNFLPAHYNQIQEVFNFLEIALIVGAGGLTQLYRWHYGRAGRFADSADSHEQAVAGVPERIGNA
jgi:hypothetical protein